MKNNITPFLPIGHAFSVKKMLRSIFSLIQNIIESDKEYNNKKSNTVIYLVSSPDNTLNVDMEIDGNERTNVKSIKEIEHEEPKGSFTITTEQGDSVTCKHYTDKQIRPKINKDEDNRQKEHMDTERTSFYNSEQSKESETAEDKSATEPHGDHGNTTMDEFMHSLYEKQNRLFERGNCIKYSYPIIEINFQKITRLKL